MKLWKKVLIALILLFVIFSGIDIFFNSSIPYNEVSDEPIAVYWGLSPVQHAENQTTSTSVNIGEFAPPKYTIDDLKLSVSNPFIDSTLGFQIECSNYSQKIDFLNNGVLTLNLTKITEYENYNLPDIAVVSPIIKDGNFTTWIQVWQEYQQVYPYQPLSKPLTKPFLTQTTFDTWEAKFRFDDSYAMVPIGNITFDITSPLNYSIFSNASISRITFTITLPTNYEILNSGDVEIESIPNTPINAQNQFIVSKTISPRQTFQLQVVDKNLEPVKNFFGYVGGIGMTAVIISIGAELLIEYLWNKQNSEANSDKNDTKSKGNKTKKSTKKRR